ncbi:hypothetical protein H0I76_09905 [Limibaculum sp. M0105]|uniref:DNA-binding protein n=1 Tax=Thermohalobaculum xanthum TaxID=2753746 RepID=A0A8J7M793_9RHOB|nr:hypothetical protein [Thermohalobaculum xanthum]MBK0399505.1 hypothetical protein [Thermohalobaculum xanthum]
MPIYDPEDDPNGYLPSRKVRSRYNISGMTLDRWSGDEDLDFPAPIYIGRNRFWSISELKAWEASLPRNKDRSRQAGVAA